MQPEKEMKLYTFHGAVWVYKTLATRNYRAKTRAGSEKKALSNLAYQYKKANNLANFVKVTLIGDLDVT